MCEKKNLLFGCFYRVLRVTTWKILSSILRRKRKPPVCRVFGLHVWCFSSLVRVLMDGVKNTCRANLKMRQQVLWLAKRITFLCILWILMSYIKISWHVPGTEYACSWEPHRLDDYQNCVSLETKTKSTVVKISLVTTNMCFCNRFMPRHGESNTDHLVPWSLPGE